MYAYSSFPSRFAVFRGSYHSTLRTELVDSIMIFDTTPSADESFYTATLRPWQGYIVGDDNMPDNTVRTVKIHSPLRTNYYGVPFSPSNERFIILPFHVETIIPYVGQSTRIPILAFESTNWMPRVEQLNSFRLLHMLEGESFKHHYRNVHYVAGALMRSAEPLPPYIEWLRSLHDPYAPMNRAEIRAIPYGSLSPTNVHTLRRSILEEYCRSNRVARAVLDAAAAAATQPPPELPHLNELDGFTEDYSSMFDAAAGYVPPADEEEQPPAAIPNSSTIPTFILENHLAHEVQKGTECPITFEPLSSLAEVAMSPACGHFFQQDALKAWGKAQLNARVPIACPVCRKQLHEVVTMPNKSYTPAATA